MAQAARKAKTSTRAVSTRKKAKPSARKALPRAKAKPPARAAQPKTPTASRTDRDMVLQVQGLRTSFFTREGEVKAVDDVSFDLRKGETLGIVGESGCGKSVTSLSILRLVPDPPGKIVAGKIMLEGKDLMEMNDKQMQAIRGNDISMIFQEPMTSLNPVLTIGHQISEAVVLHQGFSKKEALNKAVEMLEVVKIPEAKLRVREYPHQLSGGMRQRAMIAMALSCNPKVLIADEPTTALDVTIQAQILELIGELQDKLGTAVILITHDLGVIAETAQRVVVMYAGKKVEESDVGTIFSRPLHPYTHGLLASVPRLDIIRGKKSKPGERLMEIPGIVPLLSNLPDGCVFAPRCTYADDQCTANYPPYEQKRSGQWVACWHSDKLYGGKRG
jgi:peptide/nickel transport system ATP-binding protein